MGCFQIPDADQKAPQSPGRHVALDLRKQLKANTWSYFN